MSGCPSDSSQDAIACLLRSISSNTVPSWDWNPLNFAVTASIGVLALIVALITVFQGLLAAGPGRIKASNLAIGPFSTLSKSRFDRTEIALRTTARVPLVTFDVLYHRIVRQKYKLNPEDVNQKRKGLGLFGWRHDNTGQLSSGEEGYDGRTTIGTTSINRRHQYDTTATWLTLLTALGLDDPTLFPLVQRVTDYLPADVQAAPAAFELRCLAILAAIADSNSTIERQDRFFRVSADTSQLVFREHPSLGQVAAYEAYEATAILKVSDAPPLQFGSRYSILPAEDLDRCLQLASGRLAYADGRIPPSIDAQPEDGRGFVKLINDLQKRSGNCGHQICQHASDDWDRTLSNLRDHRRLESLNKLMGIYVDISLLAAERANLCRAFPRTSMHLKQCIDDISSLSVFWRSDFTYQKILQLSNLAVRTFWNSTNLPRQNMLSATWVVELTDIQSTVRNPFEFVWQKRWQYFKEEKVSQHMTVLRTWLARQRNEESNVVYDKDHLSNSVLAQLLACIDEWLLRYGGVAASCTTLNILYKLGRDKDLLKFDRGSSSFDEEDVKGIIATENVPITEPSRTFDDPSAVSEKKSKWNGRLFGPGKAQSISNVSVGECVVLLVFRGLLMAHLFDNGADTSLLFQPDFRNPTVKML